MGGHLMTQCVRVSAGSLVPSAAQGSSLLLPPGEPVLYAALRERSVSGGFPVMSFLWKTGDQMAER